jgi:hypothetical protein
MAVKCDHYKDGQCLNSDKSYFNTSACKECNRGKGAGGKRLKHPICVLICDCEEETCNIGELI